MYSCIHFFLAGLKIPVIISPASRCDAPDYEPTAIDMDEFTESAPRACARVRRVGAVLWGGLGAVWRGAGVGARLRV